MFQGMQSLMQSLKLLRQMSWCIKLVYQVGVSG